jgi:advillin
LFHVRGTNALNTVGVQVPEVSSNLNSADCFVLVTPQTVHVWKGSGATDDEQTVALNIGNILAGSFLGVGGRAVVTVNEGGESDEFWTALGGKTEYASVRAGEPAPRDPRLFQCSTATGSFRVEEIVDFDQGDLNDEDVMLLDCYTAVFVWVGSQSSTVEKTKSMEFAAQFVQDANDGRDPDCPIMRVSAGVEPAMFTAQFVGWDSSLAEKNKFVDPYQAKLDALAKEKAQKLAAAEAAAPAATTTTSSTPSKAAPVATTAPAASVTQSAPASSGGVFSYEALKSGIPDGVDPTMKETYLSDAEFQTLFGTSKAEFAKQPGWKRQAKKKELGLF